MRKPNSALAVLSVVLCAVLAGTVRAETVACPELSSTVQVGICPSDEELKYGWGAYCGDGGKLYGKEVEHCGSFEAYRKLKNIALWESRDGTFNGYVGCDRRDGELLAFGTIRLTVAKQGSVTQLRCRYSDKLVFTYRTHAACRLVGSGSCERAADCRAECDKDDAFR